MQGRGGKMNREMMDGKGSETEWTMSRGEEGEGERRGEREH